VDEIERRTIYVASSLKDLKSLPLDVQEEFALGLYEASRGGFSGSAKVLKGFSGASVIELRENFCGNTYRAVYTVRYEKVIYVLHIFQKKSNHGIATAKKDIELVKSRLKIADDHYKQNYS
jgi:phage-related protein